MLLRDPQRQGFPVPKPNEPGGCPPAPHPGAETRGDDGGGGTSRVGRQPLQGWAVSSGKGVQNSGAVQNHATIIYGQSFGICPQSNDSGQGCQAVLTLRWPHRAAAGAAIPWEGGMIGARRQLVFRGLEVVQEGKILCNFVVVCLNSPLLQKLSDGG